MLVIGKLYQIRTLTPEEERRERSIFKRSWKKTVMWLDLTHDNFAYVDLMETPWMSIDYLKDLAHREYYTIVAGGHMGWIEWTGYLEMAPAIQLELAS